MAKINITVNLMIAPVSQWGTTWWVMSHSYSHYTVNTAASCQEAEKRAWASSWIMKLHNSRISPLIVSMATHFNLNNHHIVEETSTKSNRFTLQSSFGSLKCFNDSNKTFVLLGGGGSCDWGGHVLLKRPHVPLDHFFSFLLYSSI